MTKKRIYINPTIVAKTISVLTSYRDTHPFAKTPMADVFNERNEPESEHQRYYRAAKRLGWNVTKSQGHIYENGYFIW